MDPSDSDESDCEECGVDVLCEDEEEMRDEESGTMDASEGDDTYAEHWAHMARPQNDGSRSSDGEGDDMCFMLVDVECVIVKYQPRVVLHGVDAGGRAITVAVKGFLPTFRLRVTPPTIEAGDEEAAERLGEFVRRVCAHVEGHERATKMVESVRLVGGRPAYPYEEHESVYLEVRLARFHLVGALARYFERSPEVRDSRTGTTHKLLPYSAEDATTQFMVQCGLSGFGWVRVSDVTWNEEMCVHEADARRVRAASDGVNADEVAPLRVLGLDIECAKDPHGGLPSPETCPIIAISALACLAETGGVFVTDRGEAVALMWHASGEVDGAGLPAGTRGSYHRSETGLLRDFGALLEAWDPDVIVGHNVCGFDLPYIVRRAHYLGCSRASILGKGSSTRLRNSAWREPRRIVRRRRNGTVRETFLVSTPGVVQLDTLTYMRSATQESSYTLNALSRKYLNDGKDDVGYNMITPLWHRSPQTRARLMSYCLKDTVLSMRLAAHKAFEMLLSVVTMARVTRVPAPRLLSSGNQEKVKTLVLHCSTATSTYFPYETPAPRSRDDKYKGATVIEPRRGRCPPGDVVVCADFQSLYPSIMISHNICYTTVLLPSPVDAKKAVSDATIRENDGRDRSGLDAGDAGGAMKGSSPSISIPSSLPLLPLLPPIHSLTSIHSLPSIHPLPPHDVSPSGTAFVSATVRPGILPTVLRQLLDSRAEAKAQLKKATDPATKRLLDSRQLQLKVVANSVYGVLSASGGWFVRMELGESVTAWGRDMIHRTRAAAEADPWRARCVYGDTDSVMLIFPGITDTDRAFETLRRFCETVTAMFPRPVALQAEKVYLPGAYVQEGKKRYAGMALVAGASSSTQAKLESRGLELRRMDNCPLIRKTMERVLLSLTGDPTSAGLERTLAYVRETCAQLLRGEVPVEDLVITRSITRLVTPPAKASTARTQMKTAPPAKRARPRGCVDITRYFVPQTRHDTATPETDSGDGYAGKQVHVQVALRMRARDPSYSVASGERIPYIVVANGKDPKHTPLCERAEDPLWAITHGMLVDYAYYVEKQLARPLSRILMWYVAPPEALQVICAAEDAVNACPTSEARVKALHKRIDELTDRTMDALFGQTALSGIARAVTRGGPLARFFTSARARDGTGEEDARISQLIVKRDEYRRVCAQCRGYDEEGMSCCQRDCVNLFRRAVVSRDIEDLTAKRSPSVR